MADIDLLVSIINFFVYYCVLFPIIALVLSIIAFCLSIIAYYCFFIFFHCFIWPIIALLLSIIAFTLFILTLYYMANYCLTIVYYCIFLVYYCVLLPFSWSNISSYLDCSHPYSSSYGCDVCVELLLFKILEKLLFCLI